MKNIYIICLVIFISIMSGCTPPDDEDNYSSTYYLCRTSWISFFYDQGVECSQHLIFYEDGRGKEIFTYYYLSGPAYDEYQFQWQWYQDNTSIEMQYGDNILYFDDISVYTDYLSGYFDGDYVEFDSY